MIFSLLDPRVWIAVALSVALSFGAGYFKGDHARGKRDELERAAAVSQANAEARKMEQLRQSRVDEASRLASARERRILADAADARGELDGLRGDNAALRAVAKSFAAADEAFRVTAGLLEDCSRRYLRMAEDAARADSEARELRQAWPK